MSKTDNLTDFLTDVARAIREKRGGGITKINPQSFSSMIRGMDTVSSVSVQIESYDTAMFFGTGDDGVYYLRMTAEDSEGFLSVYDGNMSERGSFNLYTGATDTNYIVAIVCVRGYVALSLFAHSGEPSTPQFITFEGDEVWLEWIGRSSDVAYLSGIFYMSDN